MSLNLEKLNMGFKYVTIGKLSQNVIDLLGLSHSECDIIMWEDKYKYIYKHIEDFKTEENFYNCISKIPETIADPDYIGVHPTKNSIEYIKRIDELFIVAIRVKNGKLALKTAFPLTEKQLQDYIKSNTVIEIKR